MDAPPGRRQRRRGRPRRLGERVADALPAQEVRLAYVDVQEPRVAEVLDDVMTRHDDVVVVPLLLSRGFHVDVDIADAVAAHPGSRAVSQLGPDPLLAERMVQGLAAQEAAGWLGTSAASIERRWDLALRAAIDGLAPR